MSSSLFLLRSTGLSESNINNITSIIGDKLFNLATLFRETQSNNEVLLNTSSNIMKSLNNPLSEAGKEAGTAMTGAIVSACTELGISIMGAIVKGAYPICLFSGIIGLIFYMFGYEKAKPIPVLAIGAFLLIKVLGGIICGI